MPASKYLLLVDNKNTRKRCEICLKLTIKTPERHHFLMFLLLSLNRWIFVGMDFWDRAWRIIINMKIYDKTLSWQKSS